MRIMRNIQEASIVEDVTRNIQRIYAALDNRQVYFQSNMIEVVGKIANQPIAILIAFGASHSYIYPYMVERFHFKKSKHDKSWMVQLVTQTKRKINELVKYFQLDMNGLNTFSYSNTISFGS